MFKRLFEDELDLLRNLGAEFSKAHPAVARMLSGPAADPDVERLLEGVAFLTALLKQKLDDEFPEIVHEMINLVFPHYLRPFPPCSVLTFSPKPTLKQPMTIKKETMVASKPVDGTPCFFKTCYDVEVHPLTISGAVLTEPSGRPPAIELTLDLAGITLTEWEPEKLRLFLGGSYTDAANLYLILRNHLKKIVIESEDGKSCSLPPDHLAALGFDEDDSLVFYPSQSFSAYRLLQEYFVMPEKFLFFDLSGWDHWKDRGDGNRFHIRFELDRLPFSISRIKKENFVLSATPIVNLFDHSADPIRLDHRKSEYLIRPSGSDPSHYQIYSVENVTGFVQGTAKERKYRAFEVFSPESDADASYHVKMRKSPIRRETDVYLSVAYPPNSSLPDSETLSIQLSCSNGALAENIKTGDICMSTGESPEFVDYENLFPPTPNVMPPLGQNLLWRLLSHLSLNYASLADAENLRSLLDLYVFEDTRDRQSVLANRKRIAGIKEVTTKDHDQLVSGIMMRGRRINVKISHDNFASEGDMYLFGSVMDHFLGSYASLNTFTMLVFDEIMRGDKYQWPSRIGDRLLI